MTTFSTAEAEKHLSKLLEQARAQGEVRIKGVDDRNSPFGLLAARLWMWVKWMSTADDSGRNCPRRP